MAYLRGNWYVWNDGNNMHVWVYKPEDDITDYVKDCEYSAGVAIPNEVFDALVCMRMAEIDASHNRRKYEQKALINHGGNTSSAALYERLGQTPPWRNPKPIEPTEPVEPT